MKTSLIVLGVIGLLASGNVFAGNADGRIDVSGVTAGIQLEPGKKPAKGYLAHASWMDAEKNKQVLTSALPTGSEWQQVEFSFTPAKSGKVSIRLMGKWAKVSKDAKELKQLWVLYDKITVEGAQITNGDFTDNAKGWTLYGPEGAKGQWVADEGKDGKGCVKAWHSGCAQQVLDVTEGQEVTIKVWCKTAATTDTANMP